MARTISAAALSALLAQQTKQVFLTLLDISHSGFANTFHFVNNPVPIVSNGSIYQPFPFMLDLPEDTAERPPRANLVVGNVTREIMDEIRTISANERIRVDFHVIMASEPDNYVDTFANYELQNISYDALTIQGELILGDFLTEPFPPDRFTPNLFPALF